jgi:hypothetical protein
MKFLSEWPLSEEEQFMTGWFMIALDNKVKSSSIIISSWNTGQYMAHKVLSLACSTEVCTTDIPCLCNWDGSKCGSSLHSLWWHRSCLWNSLQH